MKHKNDMKKLTLDDLQTELMSLRKQQFEARMKKATGALKQTHTVRQIRKNIARVKTFMTENAGVHDVK